MWKLVVFVAVILLVTLILLRPGFYFQDGTAVCGDDSKTCICTGQTPVQKPEEGQSGDQVFCQGFGVSFSR